MDGNEGYWLTRLLLQRGVGLIYLVAFLVVVNQFRPLCGEKGLLSVSRFMQFATFREAPSIFFLFQGTLIVSGNFSWLNFLTLILAFSTFNDAQLGSVLPLAVPQVTPLSAFHSGVIWCVALLVAFLSIKPVRNLFSSGQVMNTSYNPLHQVNTYGAFGSITRERFEIVLEGTDEAVVLPTTRWQAYEFKGKPGDIKRLPSQFAPYHLRLDWLMWFAAMPSPYYDPWFIHLLAKLLDNDAPTIALLKNNPFPSAPPRHLRALHYRYRFTTPEERKKSGEWWHRELAGTYFPPVSPDDPSFRKMLEKSGF